MFDFIKYVFKLDIGMGFYILILFCIDFFFRYKDCYEKLCIRIFFNVFVIWVVIWRELDSKNVNSWLSNL